MGLVKALLPQVEMYGYLSGETAFDPAYQRARTNIAGFANDFDQNIIAPLAYVAQNPDLAAHVQIIALADRVDTAGLSREQIRQQEFQASLDRANAASDGLFAILNNEVGGGLGSGWSDVNNIAEFRQGIGASILAESGPNLSEAQRQRNRRVFFAVVTYQ
jgi:hypothetical protein